MQFFGDLQCCFLGTLDADFWLITKLFYGLLRCSFVVHYRASNLGYVYAVFWVITKLKIWVMFMHFPGSLQSSFVGHLDAVFMAHLNLQFSGTLLGNLDANFISLDLDHYWEMVGTWQ